jgi:acetyltransferase-like isoleucine patch superfamily enzyme
VLNRAWLRGRCDRLLLRAWHRLGEAGKITSSAPGARGFAHFGDGSAIAFPQGTILGEKWISIGHFTLVGPHVTISAGFLPEYDLGPEPIVRIGSGVVLGRGSHVIGHESIDIGDDVYTGPYVYITDQNHGYLDTQTPIGKQWPVNAPVSIGSGSWLGTGAVVLPGTRIGKNVVVAAGSVVRGEVPDYCVVAGVPAKIVKIYDEQGEWTASASAST